MMEKMQKIQQQFDEMHDQFMKHIDGRRIEIPGQGILAGPIHPVMPMVKEGQSRIRDLGWDNAHFPLNYRLLMQEGISGIIARASVPRPGLTASQQMYRELVAKCWIKIREYVRQHGEAALARVAGRPEDADRLRRIASNCLELTRHAPESFEQGLQLFWFVWRLRSNCTSCIGRMDVHLRALYERDMPQRISREEVLDLLCELWEKLNEVYAGDTLMNLMVGGVDAAGLVRHTPPNPVQDANSAQPRGRPGTPGVPPGGIRSLHLTPKRPRPSRVSVFAKFGDGGKKKVYSRSCTLEVVNRCEYLNH